MRTLTDAQLTRLKRNDSIKQYYQELHKTYPDRSMERIIQMIRLRYPLTNNTIRYIVSTPKHRKDSKEDRNREIVESYRSLMKRNPNIAKSVVMEELASRYNLSYSTVSNVIADANRND